MPKIKTSKPVKASKLDSPVRVGSSQNKGSSFFRFVFLVVFVGLIALGGYTYYEHQEYSELKSRVENLNLDLYMSDEQIDELVTKVARHIVLPVDVKPTVKIIDDVSLVAGEPFFANASNGDILFVYTERAILYSEDKDVIVNVAPVYVEQGVLDDVSDVENTGGEETVDENVEEPELVVPEPVIEESVEEIVVEVEEEKEDMEEDVSDDEEGEDEESPVDPLLE